MTTIDVVRALVEPLLRARGVELVDVEHARGMLRVYVDLPGGGIDLEAITGASEAISMLLDEHDPIPGRYTLEVSSPGLERPLKRPEHFQRFVGTLVSVKTHPHVEGERRMQGILESADADGITVAGRAFAYGDIERARTVFEWGPTPKKGARPKAGAPAKKTKAAPSKAANPKKKAATS